MKYVIKKSKLLIPITYKVQQNKWEGKCNDICLLVGPLGDPRTMEIKETTKNSQKIVIVQYITRIWRGIKVRVELTGG